MLNTQNMKSLTNFTILFSILLTPTSQVFARNSAIQNPPTSAAQGSEADDEQNYNFDDIDAAAPVDKSKWAVGVKAFVKANAVNLRAAPDAKGKYLESLNQGDVLQILDLLVASNSDFVQVKVLASSAAAMSVGTGYVSLRMLTLDPNAEDIPVENSKYFIIQNIATERARVYERCTDSANCHHKMIFETEIVAGRPEEGTKDDEFAFVTMLGKGLIARWIKFHGNETYPAWYSPSDELGDGRLKLPAPHDLSSWFVKYNGQTTNKGAFGWYKAELYPSAGVAQQWIHGTIGWGADQDDAIEATRGFWINVFANPGSHGCTRYENQAVAFMRSFLPVGTPVYRIYAREAQAVAPKMERPKWWKPLRPVQQPMGEWNWILTKNGAGNINGMTADATEVTRLNVSANNILEKGTFRYDRTPDAVSVSYLERASSGKSGDRYELTEGRPENLNRFQGYFIVDEGRLLNYRHPVTADKKIRVGGLPEFYNNVPDYLAYSGSTNIWVPEVVVRKDDQENR